EDRLLRRTLVPTRGHPHTGSGQLTQPMGARLRGNCDPSRQYKRSELSCCSTEEFQGIHKATMDGSAIPRLSSAGVDVVRHTSDLSTMDSDPPSLNRCHRNRGHDSDRCESLWFSVRRSRLN